MNTLKNRRSIYTLGNESQLSNEEAEALIKETIKYSPTAFNSQTQRAVILFGDAHRQLWSITEDKLKPLTPVEAFPNTQAKLQGFANGQGTVLFFEDMDVVKGLQEQFSLYAENFPVWSEHATGLTQSNVWMALSEAGLGVNLQHYNPIIDDDVATTWNVPSSWKLRAQLVFGSVEEPAGDKEFMDESDRYKVFH